MNHKEKARDFHDQGFGCAQSVLSAFCEEYGLDLPTAQRLSTGFSAGMSRMGNVCGALTGGFMVLGLKYGKLNADGSKSKPDSDITYEKVTELTRRFRELNDSIDCRDLTGLDLSKPEARAYAKDHNIYTGRCNGYIKDVVGILEELLSD
jgi:C_GCAxxG_C_C family probable redox protein